MNKQALSKIKKEMEAVESGKIVPGRVWIVNKRADGTVERVQMDPEEYRRGQAAAAARPESAALTARRKLGVSQDEFAAMLGISPATLRNWEQGRRQPTGAAALLLRVAAQNPQAVLAAAA